MRSLTSTLGATLPTGSVNNFEIHFNLLTKGNPSENCLKLAYLDRLDLQLTLQLALDTTELDKVSSENCLWVCLPI